MQEILTWIKPNKDLPTGKYFIIFNENKKPIDAEWNGSYFWCYTYGRKEIEDIQLVTSFPKGPFYSEKFHIFE